MDVVNLYTMSGCPKCKTLKDICEKSVYISDCDFKIMEVNTNNLDSDPSYQILSENGIGEMPALLVDNCFYTFAEAVKYIRQKDEKYVKEGRPKS